MPIIYLYICIYTLYNLIVGKVKTILYKSYKVHIMYASRDRKVSYIIFIISLSVSLIVYFEMIWSSVASGNLLAHRSRNAKTRLAHCTTFNVSTLIISDVLCMMLYQSHPTQSPHPFQKGCNVHIV